MSTHNSCFFCGKISKIICELWRNIHLNSNHCYMSRVMRKLDFCICENIDADQLRGNREADQRLCFRYKDSTIPLLSESKISSLWPYAVIAQPGLCQTWSETPKTGFLTKRLIYLPSLDMPTAIHFLNL